MYLNKANVFILSNHKKNKDYYENQNLSYLMTELWFYCKWGKEKLFLPNQESYMCIPMKRTCLSRAITQRMKIITRFHICFIWKTSFDYIKNREKSFSYKTKASISCTLIKRTYIGKITKRMEIITRIHVCLFWCLNLDSKENGGKKSFSCKTQASISYILMRRMCLQCPIIIMKRMKITTWIHVCLFWQINFDSK